MFTDAFQHEGITKPRAMFRKLVRQSNPDLVAGTGCFLGTTACQILYVYVCAEVMVSFEFVFLWYNLVNTLNRLVLTCKSDKLSEFYASAIIEGDLLPFGKSNKNWVNHIIGLPQPLWLVSSRPKESLYLRWWLLGIYVKLTEWVSFIGPYGWGQRSQMVADHLIVTGPITYPYAFLMTNIETSFFWNSQQITQGFYVIATNIHALRK